jgi:HTH-type transcriptional regulator / antitoxin HipB
MSLSLYTPAEIALELADRVRDRRLARAWTQAELAERAGLALPTLKLFERTGKISLDRLLRIASALGALEDFRAPFAPPPARSLEEIEAQTSGHERRYGRRRPRTLSTARRRRSSAGGDPATGREPDPAGGSDAP